MTPTPRALELREETGDLVRRATELLTPAREIDLAEVNRMFVVRCHDALLGTLASGLLSVVAESMPMATVRFVSEAADDGLDLQRGYVDLDIGASPSPVPEISSRIIGRDRLVAAMRPDNPLALDSMTTSLFASARHVILSRRGRTRDAVDKVLTELGAERRVYAVVPTSTAALAVVAESNAVAVVAGGACAGAMRRLEIVGRDLPFELPGTPAIMLWHRRNDSDLIHAWFRDRAAEVLSAVLTQ